MLHRENPQAGIEAVVGKRKLFRHRLDRRRRALGTGSDHRRRGLDSDDLEAPRLVGARAGTDVDDRGRVAERRRDEAGDARVGRAGTGVAATEDLVVHVAVWLRAHASAAPAATSTVRRNAPVSPAFSEVSSERRDRAAVSITLGTCSPAVPAKREEAAAVAWLVIVGWENAGGADEHLPLSVSPGRAVHHACHPHRRQKPYTAAEPSRGPF